MTFESTYINFSIMKKLTLLLFTALIAFSCSNGPQPITYGQDGCHFCKMTIVDRQHASQLVTTKGKVYKFDAIECMVHYMEDENGTDYSHVLVADFKEPGQLIDAKTASYLISPEISSPMGAFLSAFNSKEIAKKTQAMYSGDIYSWDSLQLEIKD